MSLPRDLVARINEIVPKDAPASRITFWDLLSLLSARSPAGRRRVAEEYRRYYARRPPREVEEERQPLADWEISDARARRLLEARGVPWPSCGAVDAASLTDGRGRC